MATRIRCLKCFKIIECAPYDTQVLLNHIRTDHPEIELPDDDTMAYRDPNNTSMNNNNNNQQWKHSTPTEELPPVNSTMEEEVIRNPGQKPMYTRKYKVHSPRTPRSPQKRRLYKTSIEKWRPANGTIFCPKCGAKKRPLVKTRSEKLSTSTIGAACILTCWPLCFLPCLFPAPTKEYLHCAECNNFLGMYDRQNNCVRPNREFVEGGGCQDRREPDKTEEKRSSKVHSVERKSI